MQAWGGGVSMHAWGGKYASMGGGVSMQAGG